MEQGSRSDFSPPNVRSSSLQRKMRLLQYTVKGSNLRKVGALLKGGEKLVDVSSRLPGTPSFLKTILETVSFPQLKDTVDRASQEGPLVSASEVQLLAPISLPDKVICIGLNYLAHCQEQNARPPRVPVICSKWGSCIVGPYDEICYPSITEQLDYEVELAFVIGRQGKSIKESDAMEYVLGYTVAQDVSARDWQMKKNARQWLLGKSMDTFCPMGPVLVTQDEIPDPHNLGIRCRVNGIVKQDSNTNNLIHRIPALVAFASKFFTLLPGDVFITGTPPGVGIFKQPPELLKKGDIVESEIDEIGCLRNKYMVKGSNLRKVGALLKGGEKLVDVSSRLPGTPSFLKTILETVSFPQLKDDVDRASQEGPLLSASEVQLLAPISLPDKVICIGLNYLDHCQEQNAPPPKEPVIFSKWGSCIVGPYDEIYYPSITEQLDYEVELAFVIGRQGKSIKESEAMEYVFGYTVAQDVSARDWQMKKNARQWLLGKCMDTFCPMGPVLVTQDEIPDPHNLGIRCRVNGIVKQDSNTNNLIHRIPALVAFASKFFTLLPGDVFITGTPPGVGIFKQPPELLKKGDIVESEIDEIGCLRNKVV
ncbi:unnamed protein product [Darwinula stevensoni]|uniref:Fumarylacetoacetase-like C-terminal domain-containing protein n=1 Tax=Darwinula stevensoni TaxID=69355 RepID=A0A7R9ACZ1_9CRUS|nr:unnamed protein product [Darwinula stevensoni]CAG0900637.1 unnamed protein product [Darwinula stevensoni]